MNQKEWTEYEKGRFLRSGNFKLLHFTFYPSFRTLFYTYDIIIRHKIGVTTSAFLIPRLLLFLALPYFQSYLSKANVFSFCLLSGRLGRQERFCHGMERIETFFRTNAEASLYNRSQWTKVSSLIYLSITIS